MTTSKEMGELKIEVCKILTRIGALRFGTFTLTGGRLSPYYIDLRIVPSIPEAFNRVVNMYLDVTKNEIKTDNFSRIAGIPTAGVPFASVLAYSLSKPFLYVRKEASTHGRERRVEGILQPGDQVLLVDDVITTGGSLLTAVDAIRAEGGVVKDVLVLIDREEGGREALAKIDVELHCLTKISEMAKFLYEMETISKEQFKDIQKQIKK
ncbi:MAG: orotate phosphoribosyltransferase [Thermoproteota archaeon]|nr:orotate phosphoribosyltransferase [Thermoproteota archaeon]